MSGFPSQVGFRTLGAALVAALGCGAPTPDQARAEIDRISAGIEFFEARVAHDPLDHLSRRQLMSRYGERFALAADFADVARAESMARVVVANSSDRARDWSRLSAILLMQHRFAEALESADSAVHLAPASAEALGAWYDAALASGQYPRALATLQRLPPREVSTQARWAAWHLSAGSADAAWAAQERVCRALDRGAAPAISRAWCLTELGRQALAADQPDQAAAIFRSALAVQPGYRGAIEGIASLAHARGEWSRSRRLYQQLLSNAHPDLLRRVAEAERGLGRLGAAADAEAQFARSVAGPGQEALQGPEIARHLLGQGGEWRDSALAVARREVSRRPTFESWALLAEILRARGDGAEARAAEQSIAAIRQAIAQAVTRTPTS